MKLAELYNYFEENRRVLTSYPAHVMQVIFDEGEPGEGEFKVSLGDHYVILRKEYDTDTAAWDYTCINYYDNSIINDPGYFRGLFQAIIDIRGGDYDNPGQSVAPAVAALSSAARNGTYSVKEYGLAMQRLNKPKPMNIKEVKKALGIKNADIAKYFGYKNELSYNTSARRGHIEAGIIAIYQRTLQAGQG